MIKSMAYIFFFQLCGEAVTRLFNLPLPGNVLGMVLLTAVLVTGRIKLESVKPAADVLLKNLAFLFVPPGVGLMLYFDLIKEQWPALGAGFIISTFSVLAVVGLIMQKWVRR